MAPPSDESKPPPAPSDMDPTTAPDPDEDDLDDLDDMLDEFASTKLQEPQPTTNAASSSASAPVASPETSGPGRPADPTQADSTEDEPEFDADFAQQLQVSMAQMLQDLESNPEMAQQFEALMSQLGAPPFQPPQSSSTPAASTSSASKTKSPPTATATSNTTTTASPPPLTQQTTSTTKPTPPPSSTAKSPPPPTQASTGPSGAKPDEAAFQDTIRRTMERMRESSTTASAASASSGAGGPGGLGDDAMMAQLLQSLGAAGEDGDGEDAFSKVLLGMMEQLTNKDVLYEPMKELDTKFPDWLQTHASSLPADDKERYETQQKLVREIVAKFDKPGYSDNNPADREYIVERMQSMQAAGAPPPHLVGDVNAAEEMLNGAESGCPQQ